MNRRTQGSLPVSKATTGFLQYKAAEGLSPNTLQSYQRDLKLWQIYAGDIPVDHISTHLIQDYLVWLQSQAKCLQPTLQHSRFEGESWQML